MRIWKFTLPGPYVYHSLTHFRVLVILINNEREEERFHS